MDPATTEIHTYGHTFSLHDALPISVVLPNIRRGLVAASFITVAVVLGEYTIALLLNRQNLQTAIVMVSKFDPFSPVIVRSEEHTSELQSLMRNSYAVFCLKKTNNRPDRTTLIIQHTTALILQ